MVRKRSGRVRVVIEGVSPEIDCGRFPVKRVAAEEVTVEADIFADGHDAIAAALLYRREEAADWHEAPMRHLGNDRWRGRFRVEDLGRYRYTAIGWVDRFESWRRDLKKRLDAQQDVAAELLVGAGLIDSAARRAPKKDAASLRRWASRIRAGSKSGSEEAGRRALDPELAALMNRYPNRSLAGRYARELQVVVDRERARFSAWYEMFPRSASGEAGRHGSFEDCEALLPYVAEMGFDVLYLPPVHPIGVTNRKGRNNKETAMPGDPGCPWAIGGDAGGFTAIHPDLGTLDDFRRLVESAAGHGLEIALDIAFQCSPDHPYVRDHPDWFLHRPDGTIRFAENPPKKYQDIYPLDFETKDYRALWAELRDVVLFWIRQGVRIFRVDNPHTKPFAFWEWLIDEVKQQHPDVLFLSEAFTRPKVMYRLAKLGFTQSYTYFAWRNTADELREYLTELTRTQVSEFFRPNFWPNTPDILTEYLQTGGRPAFITRLTLAATLAANYGIYGPAFELLQRVPREAGSEEYLDSEKYQLRVWDRDDPASLRGIIGQINRIRRENPALQSNRWLRFHDTENDQLLAYSKQTERKDNVILVVVNIDPVHRQSGWVRLPLAELGLDPEHPFHVDDLLTGAQYVWNGPRNYVELDPEDLPVHVFRVGQTLRTERGIDSHM